MGSELNEIAQCNGTFLVREGLKSGIEQFALTSSI
jgi:hypothetical protein